MSPQRINIPHNSNLSNHSNLLSASTFTNPSGFLEPLANFASILFGAIPTLHVNHDPTSTFKRSLIFLPIRSKVSLSRYDLESTLRKWAALDTSGAPANKCAV